MSKGSLRLLFSSALGTALLASACATPGSGGRDAGRAADSGIVPPDAAADAGLAVDAGSPDASPHDAGPSAGDGGAADAGDGELCGDGLDDDGDGAIDEGCTCTPGETQPCYAGDRAHAGVGRCARGVQLCEGAELPRWGSCAGSIAPVAETCDDGSDDDCDGTVDEGCSTTPCEPTFLSWAISAEEMRTGASDSTGPGECFGTVYFSGSTGSTTPPGGCGVPHCGTLRYGDGRTRAQYCTVRAVCSEGTAHASGFGW